MSLVNVANSLIYTSPDNLNYDVDRVLGIVGKMVRADLIYLYLYDNNTKAAVNTHQWYASGNSPIPGEYRRIPLKDIRGIINFHLKNEAVIMPPVPSGCESAALLLTFKKKKTRSVALYPLFWKGRCYGFVGCNQINSGGLPAEELNQILSAFAGMLIRAMVRCRKETLRARADKKYISLLKQTGARAGEGETDSRFDGNSREALQKAAVKNQDPDPSIKKGRFELDLTGIITGCNVSICQLSGYSREEIIGMPYTHLYRDRPAVYKVFKEVYKKGFPIRGVNIELLCKNGSTVQSELSAFPTYNKEDKITGFKGVLIG